MNAEFYYNHYQNFMAQVETNLPLTQSPNADSIAFALSDCTKNACYWLWTNSKTTVFNYGASLGLGYRFVRGFFIQANASTGPHKTSDDGLEDAFNTPAGFSTPR